MHRYLIFLLLALGFLVSCKEDNGKVRIISDIETGKVTIDGQDKGSIRIGYISLDLPTGKHTVVVQKYTTDGEWIFEATQAFDVNKDVTNTLELITKKRESDARTERILLEKKKEEERRLKLMQIKTDCIQSGSFWEDETCRPADEVSPRAKCEAKGGNWKWNIENNEWECKR